MESVSSANSGAPSALLTAARVHLSCVLHEKVRVDLMNVKAAFLPHRRGAVDSKYRDSWQSAIIQAVWDIERVVNLGYLDLQCRRPMVH